MYASSPRITSHPSRYLKHVRRRPYVNDRLVCTPRDWEKHNVDTEKHTGTFEKRERPPPSTRLSKNTLTFRILILDCPNLILRSFVSSLNSHTYT